MLTSVYVHFPWCLKKCPYCDFASGAVRRDQVLHQRYADAVAQELRARPLGGRTLTSVFFGGGTPSLWAPVELGRALQAILAGFERVEDDVEITVECNPTSLDADRAAALRDVGVSRLSIGVQSLDDGHLRFLGRLHDAAGARRAIDAAVGEMPRVSADLMFGMPGQAPADFVEEVDVMVELGVEHVSAYALTVEPDTQFGALHQKGKLRLATEDDYAETFGAAERAFARHGFEHYEVSNYARPGAESRHNLHYWRGGDYLGLGAGAVGALTTSDHIARRQKNDPRPERYLDAPTRAAVFEETLSPEDRVREGLMLGLRTAEGVSLEEVRARTALDLRHGREAAIERRLERGDVTLEEGRLRIPRDRWLHLDAIVADLF